MTRTHLLFASLAACALALPPAVEAARDYSRGNIESIDLRAMEVLIRTPNGRRITYRIAPSAPVKFTDCPECFPRPTLRDLAPPMYVHFSFEDEDVDVIQDFDVKEIGSAPRRGSGSSSSGATIAPPIGVVAGQEMKVKILSLDERRGTFTADVAGRRQAFRTDSRVNLRDYREGDLAVITVSGDTVTRMQPAGRTGRVTNIDERRGEVGIEVNGRERFYPVENKRMLDRVKVGDRVTFDVENRGGREVVTTLDR